MAHQVIAEWPLLRQKILPLEEMTRGAHLWLKDTSQQKNESKKRDPHLNLDRSQSRKSAAHDIR